MRLGTVLSAALALGGIAGCSDFSSQQTGGASDYMDRFSATPHGEACAAYYSAFDDWDGGTPASDARFADDLEGIATGVGAGTPITAELTPLIAQLRAGAELVGDGLLPA